MIELVVVGGGEVFSNRYMSACDELQELGWLRVGSVIDVLSETEFRNKTGTHNRDFTYHRLTDNNPSSFIGLLTQKHLLSHPVAISTPTKYHVPYAIEILARKGTVAIEKPYAADRAQIAALDKVISRVAARNVFFMGYYALEKGLPLRALSADENIDAWCLTLMDPALKTEDLLFLRRSLGQVRRIQGVILEGRGYAGTLDQRSWVLELEGGGNTLETFYHLVCLAECFIDESVDIRRVDLRRHAAAALSFPGGRDLCAETFTRCELQLCGGADVHLLCAKYVPASTRQRWMRLEFEGGLVHMDFEAQAMKVETRTQTLSLRMKEYSKYAPQFMLFVRKIRDGVEQNDYALFRSALLLTLNIRDAGLQNGIQDYDADDLDEDEITGMLGGHIG